MPRWFPRAMLMQTEERVISNGPQTSRALAQISEALQYHCLNSRQAENGGILVKTVIVPSSSRVVVLIENYGAGINNTLLLVCLSELFMSESWPFFLSESS